MEDRDILADEQNGFRRGRSCEDHVFSLSSLARNHDNLYTAFIDLRSVNDLVSETNDLDLGVNINGTAISILLYAINESEIYCYYLFWYLKSKIPE